MSEHIDRFMALAIKSHKNSLQTGRGKLTQLALVIPETFKQKCLDIINLLDSNGSYPVISYDGSIYPVLLISEQPVYCINIVNTRVYESRICSLDEPDPRRVSISKKRLADGKAGKLKGTPILLLEEALAKTLKTPLRHGVENSIKRQLIGEQRGRALNALAQTSQVLISNYETAPNRLRFTWKDQEEIHRSRTLSNGVSILFEASKSMESSSWVGAAIEASHDQGAWTKGIYFPKGLSDFAKPRSVSKSKKKEL